MESKKVAIVAVIIIVILTAVVAWILMRPNEAQFNETQQSPSTNNIAAPTSEEVNVDIKGFAFTPANITVKKGTKVTWTNQDDVEHNVVSVSDAPDGGPAKTAPLLAKGESFSYTFDTVGVFNYRCTPHPNMQGTVEVTE